MWFAIMGSMFLATIAGFLFVAFRLGQMKPFSLLAKRRKYLPFWIALAVLIVVSAVLVLTIRWINCLLVIIHLSAVFLLCDLVGLLIGKFGKRKANRTLLNCSALLLTCAYLACGWYLAHHVVATSYTVYTEKEVSPLRIVQISDSHIGATFDSDGLAKYVWEINASEPDLVVITGDFVDDGTSRSEMLASCRALRDLKTKQGVYFVYGNHDKGYYSERSRGWSYQELEAALAQSGVVVLQDECVELDGGYLLIGRKDKSDPDRAAASALTNGQDASRFVIDLNHQPNDYDAEADAGMDLVLSGHTHGGQLIPITYFGEWFGMNDFTYGRTQKKDTTFIVSSGIGDWEMVFKTGCIAEYVVIDIKGHK